jgi:hypothetical protein
VVAKLIQTYSTTRPADLLTTGPKRLIVPEAHR